jgi:hypothetical protein
LDGGRKSRIDDVTGGKEKSKSRQKTVGFFSGSAASTSKTYSQNFLIVLLMTLKFVLNEAY